MSNGHMYVYRGEWKLILYSYCLIYPEIPEGFIWRKHFRNLMILNSISRHLRHQSYSDRTWKNVWRSSYILIIIVKCCHVYDRYKVLHDGRVMAIVRLADISSTSSCAVVYDVPPLWCVISVGDWDCDIRFMYIGVGLYWNQGVAITYFVPILWNCLLLQNTETPISEINKQAMVDYWYFSEHKRNRYHRILSVIARFMGPTLGIWDRQDPGGPHVGPMNFAICDVLYQQLCLDL